MPVKKRTYNHRLVKATETYSVHDIAELFNISRNTALNWIKSGLPVIDKQKPFLVHGSALIAFIKKMQHDRKKPCQPHEIYCCKCRQARAAKDGLVEIILLNSSKLSVKGFCAVCGTVLNRIGAITKLAEYQRIFPTATLGNSHIKDTTTPSVNCDMKGTGNDR